MAGFFWLGSNRARTDATQSSIEYWACAATKVSPEQEEATTDAQERAMGRFEAAAMTDVLAPAAVGRDGASPDAGSYLAMAGDQAVASRDVANCLATAADQDGASLAASYHATVDRDGASLDGHLPGVEFRAARSSDDRLDDPVDRGVAGRHWIAFRRA